MQVNTKGKVWFRVVLGFLGVFLVLPLIYSLFISPEYEASATPPSSPDTTLTLSASFFNLYIVPTGAGEINTDSLVVSVSSSNTGGYTLRMKASESNPGGVGGIGNYLVHTLSDSFTIPTLTSTTTKTSFPTNYWGYSLDDTTYKPVPASNVANSGDVIATTEVSNPIADSHTIYFSTKADTTLASGVYTNTVEFSAIGNTATVSFDQAFAFHNKEKAQALDTNYYYKMQDMTKDICNAVAHEQQTTLVDIRDQKTYTIFKSKAPDSKCWMNQNLDLDLSSSTTLYNTNTDLNSVDSWTPESPNGNTIAPGNLSASTWTDDNNNPYSYDPGDVYYYTSGGTSTDTTYNSLSACMAAPHTKAECMHYHAGNYYNLPAAVASNDLSAHTTNYEIMPDSICPKGWRLPKGPESSSGYSDFDYLLAAYNIKALGSLTYLSGGFNNIRANPLYLVRAGVVVSLSYSAYEAGNRSDYWFSSLMSATKARGLNFTSSGFVLEDHNRYDGKVIHCVAHDKYSYYLNYASNGDNVSGLPANQNAFDENSSHSFTIDSVVPTRTGYNFLGYAASAGGDVEYQPGGTVSVTKDSPVVTLYAKWGELGFNDSGITTMQAMTPTICAAASQGTTGLLQDTRDGRVYSIFKGNDNRCWMNQNLDLNLSTGTALSNTNTDLNSTTSWTPARGTVATGNLSTSTWADNNNNPYSYDSGNIYFYTSGSTANDPQHNSIAACLAADSSRTVADCKHYHAGNHYNWSAAVAKNDTSAHITHYEEMPDSICPKGWKLPQGPTGSGDYSDLDDLLAAHNIKTAGTSTDYLADGFNNIRISPLFFVRSGYISAGTHSVAGANGYPSWTSSVTSNSNAYSSYFSTSGLTPQGTDPRFYGFSVRCVASPTDYTYYLAYNANEAGVSGLPVNQVARSNDTPYTFTINSTAPTKANYSFLGYAASAGGAVEYQPGGTVSVTSSSPTITLYAKWQLVAVTFDSAYAQNGKSRWGSSNLYAMQDMNSSICSAVTVGQETFLIDTRDSNIYGVFKANDSHCWMSQNLDLVLSSSTPLYNTTTDLVAASWTPKWSTINPPYSYAMHSYEPHSYELGDTYYYTSNTGGTDITYNSMSACMGAHSWAECKHYHAGNYYNWNAAIASNDSYSHQSHYTQVTSSICPKNWRLPEGPINGSDGSDYSDLLYTHGILPNYDFYNIRRSPLYLVRAGYIAHGSAAVGVNGYYWTSAIGSVTNHGYSMMFTSSGANAQVSFERWHGFSIRCRAR